MMLDKNLDLYMIDLDFVRKEEKIDFNPYCSSSITYTPTIFINYGSLLLYEFK